MGELRTTAGEEPPPTPAEAARRRRAWRRRAALAIVLTVLLGSVVRIPRYAVASGYVSSERYAEVRSPVTGIVSRILARSGDHVEVGQTLVKLNSEEEEALLAETRARVSRLKTEIKRRETEMSIDLERRKVDLAEQRRQHRDSIAVARLRLENARTRLELTRELVAKGLKAASNLQDDRLQEQLAQVALDALRNKDFKIYADLIDRDAGKYQRELAALNEELQAQEDSVRRVEARLRTREIRAPVAGTVVRYEFVVGELLQPSSVIYEIFGGERQILKLRIGERHAVRVGPGQRYRARLSSYRSLYRRYFYGEVEHLRNVIQGDGRETYRMAYCTFDGGGRQIPPGTTAEARVYYGRSSFWAYLFDVDVF